MLEFEAIEQRVVNVTAEASLTATCVRRFPPVSIWFGFIQFGSRPCKGITYCVPSVSTGLCPQCCANDACSLQQKTFASVSMWATLGLLAGVGNRAHIRFAYVASFTRRSALIAANGSRGCVTPFGRSFPG